VDERSLRVERSLQAPVMVAALLVIPVIVIEQSSLGEPWDTIGAVLNWASWLMFLLEAVAMLAVVPNRGRWVRTHPVAVVVVLLTPPFLTALAPLRLLRILQLLRLLRFAPAVRRLFSMEGLRYVALLAAITAVGGGAAFAALERKSTAQGIYWALTTMTTLGSDVYPETAASKTLAVFVMLVGIGFVAILTGAVAQRFLAAQIEEEAAEIDEEIDAETAVILRELREVQGRLLAIQEVVQPRRGGPSRGRT
jgi:voltage-gated potassium channel